MFAVLGTLVSTFIIGYFTYLAGKLVRDSANARGVGAFRSFRCSGVPVF